MPYASEYVLTQLINRASEGNAASIAAPGAGSRIAIDYLVVHPSGGANIITLNGSISVPFSLNDNETLQLENSIHTPLGIFPCDDNQAFTVVQNLATQVEGYVLYRIVGK